MKQIICEMCGGKELIKQNGTYTCQHCGTKYSVEEAKKMLVTIDTSVKLENALKNARKARECKDYEQGEKYYNIVKMEDPENWEANFYSIYFKAYLSSNVSSVKNCIKSVLKDIKKLDDNVKQNEAIEQMSADIFDFASRTYDQGTRDENRLLLSAPDLLTSFGESLISEFGKNEFTDSINIECNEITLQLLKRLYNSNIDEKLKSGLKNLIQKHAEELRRISPTSVELAIYEKEVAEAAQKKWIGILILTFVVIFIFLVICCQAL